MSLPKRPCSVEREKTMKELQSRDRRAGSRVRRKDHEWAGRPENRRTGSLYDQFLKETGRREQVRAVRMKTDNEKCSCSSPAVSYGRVLFGMNVPEGAVEQDAGDPAGGPAAYGSVYESDDPSENKVQCGG